MAQYRAIKSKSWTEEPDKTGGNKYRGYYWRRGTRVTTVKLDCGHTKDYRGDYVPKNKALCKKCP